MSVTLDLKANVDTWLWTSTAESTHPSNGGVCRRWENSLNTAHNFDGASDAASPTYRTPTSGALLLPNCDYDGSNDANKDSLDAASTFISASAFDILVAFEVDDTSSNNANTYANPGIVGDDQGWWGIYIKNGNVRAYNWDGNDDSVGVAVSTGTAYVVRARHNSGTLYVSVNGGAESSIASGNTGSTLSFVEVGSGNSTGSGLKFNGKIGRVVIANTGDELASTYAQMVTDWVTGASATNRFLTLLGVGS